MGAPKAPQPADPGATAAAQMAANMNTATANQAMNMVNQVTPDGKLTYTQDGTRRVWQDAVYSADGKVITPAGYKDLPAYTATQTLSDQQQKTYDQNQAAEYNLAQIANQQSGKIGGLLNTNVTLGNDAAEQRLFDLGSKRLNPLFAQKEDSLRTMLANKGIQEGSDAWNREMASFNQGRNDAYNNLLLTGRGQAIQEQLAERNQPINEITALMSGSQVSQPNFVNSPQSQIANTDYAGIQARADQQKLAAWQQNQASQGGLFGNLIGGFGKIGAAALPFMLSDERAKKDIEKVGEANGLNLYEFRYKGEEPSEPKRLGLLAQEVRKKKPEAVEKMPNGLLAVDYRKALSKSHRKGAMH